MRPANRDLLIIGVLVAAGLLSAVLPLPALVKGVFWAPLACFGSGYAWVQALFPRRSLGTAEQALFSLGLSLAVLILGAILFETLGLTLQPPQWMALVAGAALSGCLVAALRRPPTPETAPAGRPLLGLAPGQWALLGLAGLLTSGALVLARLPLPAANVQGYTSLWLLPVTNGDVPRLRLGVQSAELVSVSYRVEIAPGTAPGREVTRLVLAPGESWEATLDIPPEFAGSGWIAARLYRQDAPEEIYREVTVWP